MRLTSLLAYLYQVDSSGASTRVARWPPKTLAPSGNLSIPSGGGVYLPNKGSQATRVDLKQTRRAHAGAKYESGCTEQHPPP